MMLSLLIAATATLALVAMQHHMKGVAALGLAAVFIESALLIQQQMVL